MNRRELLKLGAAAGVSAPLLSASASAAANLPKGGGKGPDTMTKGLTLANLRGNGAPRLAVKTDKGILDVTAAANRAALEWAGAMIKTTAEVLNQIKASAQVHTEGLTFMLERTDETMRTFTDFLVKSGMEMAIRTDRLSEALPAIEERARTLAVAAERIAGIVEDLRAPQKRPKWETID